MGFFHWILDYCKRLLQKISSVANKSLWYSHFVKQDHFHQWTLLLWFLKRKCNRQKFLKTRKSFKIHEWGIYWCILCRRTKRGHLLSWWYCNHRPYFRHPTKNPFKRPIHFEREPEVPKCKRISGFKDSFLHRSINTLNTLSCLLFSRIIKYKYNTFGSLQQSVHLSISQIIKFFYNSTQIQSILLITKAEATIHKYNSLISFWPEWILKKDTIQNKYQNKSLWEALRGKMAPCSSSICKEVLLMNLSTLKYISALMHL